mmetsp:Transcript_2503/g.5254  ORF Transcript_2503/g.5254 Transcript_2503/m.5254 type:complete len:212 (-) Transcript_2503:520-1155(-)
MHTTTQQQAIYRPQLMVDIHRGKDFEGGDEKIFSPAYAYHLLLLINRKVLSDIVRSNLDTNPETISPSTSSGFNAPPPVALILGLEFSGLDSKCATYVAERLPFLSGLSQKRNTSILRISRFARMLFTIGWKAIIETRQPAKLSLREMVSDEFNEYIGENSPMSFLNPPRDGGKSTRASNGSDVVVSPVAMADRIAVPSTSSLRSRPSRRR